MGELEHDNWNLQTVPETLSQGTKPRSFLLVEVLWKAPASLHQKAMQSVPKTIRLLHLQEEKILLEALLMEVQDVA